MNNVMEDFVGTLRRTTRLTVKRRWLALAVGALTAALFAVLISAVPDRYQASARLYVDTQTVLKPLMASLTYQPDIDQQVKMLARTLISRPNMEQLVRRPELQFDTSNAQSIDDVVSRLMSQIKVVPTTSGNLYEISYRETSPQQAQAVVEATVDMFVNTGAIAKKRDTQDASRFIDEQISGYESQLTEAETRLKDFRIRNFGVSGVSNQDYFARVSVLTEQVGKLRIDLTAAERSRDSYRRELALEDPQLPATVLTAGASEVDVRLMAQKNQLDELLRRFTDAHPDVISARRIVAQLQEESALAKTLRDSTDYRGGKAATSPVYQKLRLSLSQADADVAALQSQLSAQSVQLAEVRALAGRVPQVEAEHAQLNRDYDVVRKSYDAMVARRESAALGAKLDASSQMAEFRVVEPPRVSPVPVFPARLHWAMLALLASLALGIAAAVVAEMMSPTFEETSALRRLSGRPVLGTVSVLLAPSAQRAHHRAMLRFASVFGLVVALQAIWVGWIASQPHLN